MKIKKRCINIPELRVLIILMILDVKINSSVGYC